MIPSECALSPGGCKVSELRQCGISYCGSPSGASFHFAPGKALPNFIPPVRKITVCKRSFGLAQWLGCCWKP